MGVLSSWQYYGQIWRAVPFLPLQLSSNSRLVSIRRGNILMQHEPTKCTLFKLILYFSSSIFDICMFWTSWVHSQDGLKHVDDIKNWKLNKSINLKSAHFICACCIIIWQCTVKKKHKSQSILLIVQLTATLCYMCKNWIVQNSQINVVGNDPVAWNREKFI